ncbi:uncharacterized protein PFL1_02296 [Pseudozyma flocculosa PF-1]|nr:uncharacterized protein PFL1_02296 [Pseudozyma flocculosa PF-1]EPQ30180.1 hypothetical protein PFL1_02296 [Pseudozyma flocculosa PF-1]
MPSQTTTLASTCCSRPARPPTLLERALSPIDPLIILIVLTIVGLPGAIRAQFSRLSPVSWLNPFRWHELILANGFGYILAQSNKNWEPVKRPLLASARGRVLEVGAGSGENVVYYDLDRVESLVVLEPFAPLRTKLEAALDRTGLLSRSTVVPLGLDEERGTLSRHGLAPASFDTIVLVQVLCSIPNPKSHLDYLQSLLRPGGEILVFEHVASKHQPARLIQQLWTVPWKRLVGGCEMDRDSADWLRDVGGWSHVEILRPKDEHRADLMPHAVARFVKA